MGEFTKRLVNRRAGMASMVGLALMAAGGVVAAYQVPGDPQDGGPQVLARGPIHEAFAEPVVFNPSPGVVVPKPPPQTQIEEVPPAQKPEGADVEWIPGYWAWDDERNDYIWISGVWRDIPPGRQWVPGYWSPVEGGFRWTSGFWGTVAANGQLNYLPAPPPTQENGPNSPQPGLDYSWSPGLWVWVNDHYAWRPGYWVQAQPNWVWVPPSYVPTPGGYVFNEGYWDYPIARRGLPFAPVAFGSSFNGQQSYSYTPSYVLPVSGLLANLFVRPSYGQYYYGDYYGASARGLQSGYVPWFGFQQSRLGYDPLYASMSALNSQQPEWNRQIRQNYQTRIENPSSRPPTTFLAQRAFLDQRRTRGEDIRGLEMAHPLNQWANHPEANHRIVPVTQEHRVDLARRQGAVRDLQQERARMEAQARPSANVRPEQHAPQRLEFPRSPVVAASEPRFQSRGLTAPPPHPEPHQNFRPTFEREPAAIRSNFAPHPEPRPISPRPETPRGPGPRAPHPEPRPRENEERGKAARPR